MRDDGSGDLVFEERTYATSTGGTRIKRMGFLAVADVHEVERLIRSQLLHERA